MQQFVVNLYVFWLCLTSSAFYVISVSMFNFQTRWFAMLKSMVCRCYTHHGCEFMLRFCTELSKAPSTTYVFFKSLDGTTSLYNKETGQLMVTFRNENRVSISQESPLSFSFIGQYFFLSEMDSFGGVQHHGFYSYVSSRQGTWFHIQASGNCESLDVLLPVIGTCLFTVHA